VAYGAAALCGCGYRSSKIEVASEPVADVPILWQKTGSYSRLNREARICARNLATLAKVPLTEVPVDFRKEMVLIVGLGPIADDDVGVEIARVWRQGSQLKVQERRIYPDYSGAEGLERASPWAVAVIPRSDLNVEGFSARVPRGLLRAN
jgi:hypothetical protein